MRWITCYYFAYSNHWNNLISYYLISFPLTISGQTFLQQCFPILRLWRARTTLLMWRTPIRTQLNRFNEILLLLHLKFIFVSALVKLIGRTNIFSAAAFHLHGQSRVHGIRRYGCKSPATSRQVQPPTIEGHLWRVDLWRHRPRQCRSLPHPRPSSRGQELEGRGFRVRLNKPGIYNILDTI